jgi:hypothetical protein
LRNYEGEVIKEVDKLRNGTIDFSSDGKYILLIDYFTIKVYDTNGNYLRTIKVDKGTHGAAFLPDSHNIKYIEDSSEVIINLHGDLVKEYRFNSDLFGDVNLLEADNSIYYKDRLLITKPSKYSHVTNVINIKYFLKKCNLEGEEQFSIEFKDEIKTWGITHDEKYLIISFKKNSSKVFVLDLSFYSFCKEKNKALK